MTRGNLKRVSFTDMTANRTDVKTFVDAYDQLISLIKTTNPACKVFVKSHREEMWM